VHYPIARIPGIILQYSDWFFSRRNSQDRSTTHPCESDFSGELAVTALLNPDNISRPDVDWNGASYYNGILPYVAGILRYGDILQ